MVRPGVWCSFFVVVIVAAWCCVVAFAQEDGINCQRKQLCNGEMCANVCVVGTVVPDPWTDFALMFQRQLQLDVPLDMYEMPGTHNGGVAQAYSFGIEEDRLEEVLTPVYGEEDSQVVIGNQRISVKDQLIIGIRHIEIDLHRIGMTGKRIRVCHWPVCPLPFPFYVAFAANKQDIDLAWDCAQLGCTPDKPLYTDLLEELQSWLDANPQEIAIIYVDNKNVNDNHIDEFLKETLNYLGDVMFTPEFKQQHYPDRWPTIREMIGDNKRLIMENNRDSWEHDNRTAPVIFTPPIWDEGGQFSPSDFESYPVCEVDGKPFFGKGNYFVRSLDGSLVLGPARVWDSRKTYTPEDIRAMVDCSVNIQSLDQVTPTTMQYFVWSWEEDQPDPSLGNCAIRVAETGRWRSHSCDGNYFHVCVNEHDFTDLVLSTQRGTDSQGSQFCPQNYLYDLPRLGYLNRHLDAIVPNTEFLYLNLNSTQTLLRATNFNN